MRLRRGANKTRNVVDDADDEEDVGGPATRLKTRNRRKSPSNSSQSFDNLFAVSSPVPPNGPLQGSNEKKRSEEKGSKDLSIVADPIKMFFAEKIKASLKKIISSSSDEGGDDKPPPSVEEKRRKRRKNRKYIEQDSAEMSSEDRRLKDGAKVAKFRPNDVRETNDVEKVAKVLSKDQQRDNVQQDPPHKDRSQQKREKFTSRKLEHETKAKGSETKESRKDSVAKNNDLAIKSKEMGTKSANLVPENKEPSCTSNKTSVNKSKDLVAKNIDSTIESATAAAAVDLVPESSKTVKSKKNEKESGFVTLFSTFEEVKTIEGTLRKAVHDKEKKEEEKRKKLSEQKDRQTKSSKDETQTKEAEKSLGKKDTTKKKIEGSSGKVEVKIISFLRQDSKERQRPSHVIPVEDIPLPKSDPKPAKSQSEQKSVQGSEAQTDRELRSLKRGVNVTPMCSYGFSHGESAGESSSDEQPPIKTRKSERENYPPKTVKNSSPLENPEIKISSKKKEKKLDSPKDGARAVRSPEIKKVKVIENPGKEASETSKKLVNDDISTKTKTDEIKSREKLERLTIRRTSDGLTVDRKSTSSESRETAETRRSSVESGASGASSSLKAGKERTPIIASISLKSL